MVVVSVSVVVPLGLVAAAAARGERRGGEDERRAGEKAVERSCHRCRSWFPLVFAYES